MVIAHLALQPTAPHAAVAMVVIGAATGTVAVTDRPTRQAAAAVTAAVVGLVAAGGQAALVAGRLNRRLHTGSSGIVNASPRGG